MQEEDAKRGDETPPIEDSTMARRETEEVQQEVEIIFEPNPIPRSGLQEGKEGIWGNEGGTERGKERKREQESKENRNISIRLFVMMRESQPGRETETDERTRGYCDGEKVEGESARRKERKRAKMAQCD